MASEEATIQVKQTFLSQLKALLDKHKMKECLELVNNDQIRHLIASDCDILWELIPLICSRLCGLNEFRFKTFQCCQDILMEISSLCNPKEVLIALLAELENCSKDDNEDDNCFRAILNPLEYVLVCLPTKRNETLKWVLSTLNKHIVRIKTPDNLDLEGKERLLWDNQAEVKRINRLMPSYIEFIETFVREVDIAKATVKNESQKSSKTSNPNTQRIILLQALLYLLYHPIRSLDLTSHTKSESRVWAFRVVKLISRLNPNFYSLPERVDLINQKSKPEDAEIPLNHYAFDLSVAVLFYLTCCETEEPTNFIPSVYTHVYALSANLKSIEVLTKQPSALVYEKGLLLIDYLLSRITERQLSSSFMDQMNSHKVDDWLIQIMIYSSMQSLRQLALKVFQKLAFSFDDENRFKFLYSILSRSNLHSGVSAMVIKMYKDFIFENEDCKSAFVGNQLYRMLKTAVAVSLPDGEKSDLLECNDSVFATINLLRYLLLKDKKNSNATKIWDMKTFFNDNFLKPLHKALDLSKIHCKIELKKITEEMQKSDGKRKLKRNEIKFECKITNGPADDSLMKCSPEEQHKMMIYALLNFDLIESILNRVEEIINE